MRAVLAIAAAAIALSLSGCDTNTGAPAAKVGCNCATPAAPPAAAVPDMRGSTAYAPPTAHRHHRPAGYGRWSGHAYYWRREFAEISVQTYGYHSDSRSYYSDGGSDSHDGGFRRAESGWQDGYGRWHGTAGVAGHTDSGVVADARLRPWHGYDATCPDHH
jgi:hypothetical protein